VLRRLGHWLIVSALVLSIGAHWALLQSVAWVSMAVSYSQTFTLKDALVKTFDGRHPCKICKAVQEGKKSERKPESPKPITKLELFCGAQGLAVKAPIFSPICTDFTNPSGATATAPPTPPPRRVFV
jgi:hypothetical protein